MFNGYNDTPLISYEFNQERVEKKHEKWSYGHDAVVQPAQAQPNNRHAEFWPGKSNFLGIPNVVKCNCTGCYPSSEKQSYQGDTTRHRPWLPRSSYPVPVNGSSEPCKLPACQWDGSLSNQSYAESGLPYVQENGGKYSYYKHHQNTRLAEPNQPGVITSLKNAEYPKKGKSDISRGQESPVQNGTRQPVFCNPAYGITKRIDGRNYCDPTEKYSNATPYSVDQQHMSILPVVEPFTKAVPSNLSQSRVPSTGYRSIKENMPQPHDLGYGDARKIFTESEINCDQRSDGFSSGQIQAGSHEDYSHFYRNLPEMEPQKLFFDNTRHPDYYPRTNFQDSIKRSTQSFDNRKDCAVNQINDMNASEQHYHVSRRHQDVGNPKSCDVFGPKDFDKTRPENHLPGNSPCFQRNDEAKNENTNVRLPSSALIFNDPRFADRTQNSFTYQSNPVVYRNYLRPEYPCQGYNAQPRYEYPSGLQRNDLMSQYSREQQVQSCEQLDPQQGTVFAYESQRYQINLEKTQSFYRGKNSAPVQVDSQMSENRNPTYLEAIRSEELNKNGTSKISPLRLLRKKKFINVPQESAPVSTLDAVPGLDVRKFWSTWADEEEENVAPTQMVVLDCQNIDPEQAKLLHLYDTDPVRPIHLETSTNTVIKNADLVKEAPEKTAEFEENVKTSEQLPNEPKIDEEANSEVEMTQQEESERSDSVSETENKSDIVESNCGKTPPNKSLKKGKSGQENRGKSEIRDKWTAKKFDFLKRAEESKAAEILRHEEEKKKIFETRLSLQQSLKKPQEKNSKTGEEIVPERLSPYDENSETDSPGDKPNGDATSLPTSEYRRNKFLDYSDRKIIPNGEEKMEGTEGENEQTEQREIKKEENIKVEFSDATFDESWPKFKAETGFEMDDILKKMSEINFQCPEVKTENGEDSIKKPKTGKKTKKKKSDQAENCERTDKLTVETVNKQPTIKFSIQKSHDLKISFKVLNSSKEYSDEDAGGEEAQEKGKADEDSKNSTELITLEYKSIKRDGDRRQIDLKKSRRGFRRKKRIPKTPVLKIKKSRYMREEERDPLADDGDVLNVSKTLYPDKCSTSDGFQVKETMDSAKIKLTFKRHKGNFETEYKINSNNVEKVSEIDPIRREEEHGESARDKWRKKSKRGKKRQIFAEPGVEHPEADVGSDSNKQNGTALESFLEDEDSRNSSTSRDSYMKEENCSLQSLPMTFSEFSQFAVPTPENEPFEEKFNLPEGKEKYDGIESSTFDSTGWNEESSEKCDLVELTSCEEEVKFPPLENEEVDLKALTLNENVSPDGEDKEQGASFEEEIQRISLDFASKSEEIELDHNSGKTPEIETPDVESNSLDFPTRENPVEIEISESSYVSKSEKYETTDCALRQSPNQITVNGWEDIGAKSFDSQASEVIPSLECDESVNNSATPEVVEETPEVVLTLKENMGPCAVEESNDVKENPDIENPPRTEYDESSSLPDPDATADSLPKPKSDSPILEIIPWTAKSPTPANDVENPSEPEKPNDRTGQLQKDSELQNSTTFDISMENSPKPEETSDVIPLEVAEKASQEIIQDFANTDPFPPLNNDSKISQTHSDISFTNVVPLSEAVEKLEQNDTEIPDPNDSSENSENSPKHNNNQTETDGKKVADENENPPKQGGNEDISSETPKTDLARTETDDRTECNLTHDETTSKRENETNLPLLDEELEDGEVIDESEAESPEKREEPDVIDNCAKIRKNPAGDFVARKIERRHSTNPQTLKEQRKSQSKELQTWSRKKFSKAKSCPPEMKFPELQFQKQETQAYIPVESIPLPMGPPPFDSCFYLIKHMSDTQSKEKPSLKCSEEEVPPLLRQLDGNDIDNRGNLSEATRSGIFERSTKIKFSFLKRSKFSKTSLKNLKPEDSGRKIAEEVEKITPVLEKDKSPTPVPAERDPIPKKCQIEEVPNGDGELKEKSESRTDSGQSAGLPCEDLEETVEIIDTMTDFIRDEFYECEDIPTSEDFTNGEDLEIEGVNDDKFRNIMQNCLDNAKKFLNVGNLKLFSCSVDDLLELDCPGSDSSLGGNDPEKPANHISRDVLLTSCEDANDDLDLSENVQPADISMDFVPSFCTDVCPEILPVDNWPYLEEEVPSSPTKTKPDESDMIPSLENAFQNNGHFPRKNGIDRRRRKRVASETSFKRFRRMSLIPEDICSKIGVQRRKTIDAGETLTGAYCVRDFRDLKHDIMRLKNEADDTKDESLKCRVSLDKIGNKHGINFGVERERLPKEPENGGRMKNARSLEYRSPSWQPKVMLFRISKNELRKVLKSSKTHSGFTSKIVGDSTKRKISSHLGDKVAYTIKKHKSDPDFDKIYVKPVQEFGEVAEAPEKDIPKDSPNEEKLIDLSRLDSIKGSLMTAETVRKRKKSRFRNLHTKRKTEPDATKDINRSVQSTPPTTDDAETVFGETLEDSVSNDDVKNKKYIGINDGDEKSRRKLCEVKPDTSESPKGEKRLQSEAKIETHPRNRSSDEMKRDKNGGKSGKKHDHRDRRREKSEGKEHGRHRVRHKESRKHGYYSSTHKERRSPGGSRHLKRESESRNTERRTSEGDKKSRNEEPSKDWVCEVCGFNDVNERVVHIKNHPFHCQSCHLAFKTETHFISHLTKKHKDIRNQHHCLLCELSFDTEDQYQKHLETREHKHLESVEKNTINTLFTLLTGSPCPVFGLVEMRPEWLPNQAGTVHFYHQATPLSLALQYLKMHHDLSSLSTPSSAHPN